MSFSSSSEDEREARGPLSRIYNPACPESAKRRKADRHLKKDITCHICGGIFSRTRFYAHRQSHSYEEINRPTTAALVGKAHAHVNLPGNNNSMGQEEHELTTAEADSDGFQFGDVDMDHSSTGEYEDGDGDESDWTTDNDDEVKCICILKEKVRGRISHKRF